MLSRTSVSAYARGRFHASAVRYWSNYFEKFIHPQRNAKGNRLYHPEDHRSVERRVKAIEKLKDIRAQLVAVRNGL